MDKYGGLCALVCGMAVFLFHSYSLACNVCHSKNPKMLTMHAELGYKDCFSCHKPGKRKSSEEWRERRESDDSCRRCHRK